MRYANILSTAISQSGYTFSQISNKCAERSTKISRGYLSLLCAGKKPPASDELNKTLVEVLTPVSNLSYEDLIFAKYKETLSPEVINIISDREAKQCETLKTS